MFKRRIMAIRISAAWFEQLCLGDEIHAKVKNPLPKDSRIVQIGYDIMTNTLVAFVQNDSFPEVSEAEVPMDYPITLEQIEKPLLKKKEE